MQLVLRYNGQTVLPPASAHPCVDDGLEARTYKNRPLGETRLKAARAWLESPRSWEEESCATRSTERSSRPCALTDRTSEPIRVGKPMSISRGRMPHKGRPSCELDIRHPVPSHSTTAWFDRSNVTTLVELVPTSCRAAHTTTTPACTNFRRSSGVPQRLVVAIQSVQPFRHDLAGVKPADGHH